MKFGKIKRFTNFFTRKNNLQNQQSLLEKKNIAIGGIENKNHVEIDEYENICCSCLEAKAIWIFEKCQHECLCVRCYINYNQPDKEIPCFVCRVKSKIIRMV